MMRKQNPVIGDMRPGCDVFVVVHGVKSAVSTPKLTSKRYCAPVKAENAAAAADEAQSRVELHRHEGRNDLDQQREVGEPVFDRIESNH